MANEHTPTNPMPKEKLEELKKTNPELYQVAFEKATQPAFTGELHKSHDTGMFNCAVCGAQLFSSDTKFDSGTGWPSFTDALPGAIHEQVDKSLGMVRTEVVCSNCGAHLGHLFDDGPGANHCRYCINSVSLNLTKK